MAKKIIQSNPYTQFNKDKVRIPTANPQSLNRIYNHDSNKQDKIIYWNINGAKSFFNQRRHLFNNLIKMESYPNVIFLLESKIYNIQDFIKQTKLNLIEKDNLYEFEGEDDAIISQYLWHFNNARVKKGYSGILTLILKSWYHDHCQSIWNGMSIEEVVEEEDVNNSSIMNNTTDLETSSKNTLKRKTYEKQVYSNESAHLPNDNEGRITTILTKSNHVIISVYIPNGGSDLSRIPYKTNIYNVEIINYLSKLKKKYNGHLTIGGDFNVAYLNTDIYNIGDPHVEKVPGCTIDERSNFHKVFLGLDSFEIDIKEYTQLQYNIDKYNNFIDHHNIKKRESQITLYDSFKYKYPYSLGWFTYWSVRAKNFSKNRGLRLDYVLVDNLEKLNDAFILNDDLYIVYGDHCPVGVVLDR